MPSETLFLPTIGIIRRVYFNLFVSFDLVTHIVIREEHPTSKTAVVSVV